MNRIAQIREYFGLTVEKVADLVGVSRPFLTLIINGKRKPGQHLAEKFHQVFDVSPEWLIDGRGYMWDGAGAEALRVISSHGISSRDDLVFLAERIVLSWSKFKKASPPFVAKLTDAIAVLMQSLKRDSDKFVGDGNLVAFLNETLPPGKYHDVPLGRRPAHILKAISGLENAFEWGDNSARCLVALMRQGGYNEFPVKEIAGLFSPWSFWVAKRSFSPISELGEPFLIDTSIYSTKVDKTVKSMDEIGFKSKDVFLSLHLRFPEEGFSGGPWLEEFTDYYMDFPTATLTLNINNMIVFLSLSDILAFINVFGKVRIESKEESWCRAGFVSAGAYTNRDFPETNLWWFSVRGINLSLPKSIFKSLSVIQNQISKNLIILQYLTSCFIDRFGAL